MKYRYKNLKHVKLHGIRPGEIGEFDHPIGGGGIELIVEEKSEPKIRRKYFDKQGDDK